MAGYRRREGTRSEYCQREGISESALDYYLRRAKRGRIVPVEIVESGGACEIAVVLRNGRRVEIRAALDGAGLSRWIRALEHE